MLTNQNVKSEEECDEVRMVRVEVRARTQTCEFIIFPG